MGFRQLVWSGVAVLAGAAILIWLATEDRYRAQVDTALPRLFAFDVAEVHTVELRQGARRLLLERTREGGWRRRADGAPVPSAEAAIATFSRARIERTLRVEGQALARFGLDAPTLTIRLERVLAGGVEELDFGIRTADGFGRYVRRPGGETILTIPDYHWEALSALLLEVALVAAEGDVGQ